MIKKWGKTRKVAQILALVLGFGMAFGMKTRGHADGYLVRSGWTCRGSTPKFASILIEVTDQGVQDGFFSYRIRQIQGQNQNGSDSETARTFNRAQESAPAPALLSYRGENTTESATLTIRLLEKSDQSLPGNLRIVRADGTVEVIPRLSCNRSR